MSATASQEAMKQEVWKTVRELNDAWTKGDGSRLVDYFHPRMTAVTATRRERLTGRDACMADWSGFAKTSRIHSWKEIDPQIELFGDAAVVTYYFDMSFDMGCRTITMGGRDMFTFVKENGKWWAVADQFSPYPELP